MMGAACDIFALGVVLYRLLAGRMPFTGPQPLDAALQVLRGEPPPPPSQHCPGLSPQLDAICLKAIARHVADRFASMIEMADALAEYLELPTAGAEPPRPLVAPETVRFAFVGMGERAPDPAGPQDHLWLDVGNDLRPGVIDHHHLTAGTGSTTSLVLAYPAFIDGSVLPSRRAQDPFTLVLHDKPDLDAVASAYLALGYLGSKAFPAGADALARYVDEVDDGVRGVSQDNPFALYAAFQQMADRLLHRSGKTTSEVWLYLVRRGIRLIDFVLEQMSLSDLALPAVDAFACPGLFEPADREEIANDLKHTAASSPIRGRMPCRRTCTCPASSAERCRSRPCLRGTCKTSTTRTAVSSSRIGRGPMPPGASTATASRPCACSARRGCGRCVAPLSRSGRTARLRCAAWEECSMRRKRSGAGKCSASMTAWKSRRPERERYRDRVTTTPIRGTMAGRTVTPSWTRRGAGPC